ncbi:kanadaptin-like [Styela clava]
MDETETKENVITENDGIQNQIDSGANLDSKHIDENKKDSTELPIQSQHVTDSATDSNQKTNDDGFLMPMILPPVAKTVKKDDTSSKRSPVTMAFRSKFAVPADIYKAPKAAAFITMERSARPKTEKEERNAEPASDESSKKSSSQNTTPKPKPPPAKLSYESPDWGSEPEERKYSLEVLKMGSIIDKIDLSNGDYFLVGRLPDCHIKMEHPSISRYHSVLQYGAPTSDCEDVELQKDGSYGFYVYDLGSTHGTMINKQNILPKIYYRIKVGHVVKFGGSTRLFILQGPQEDEEMESTQSATELREFNKNKIKKKKDLERMMLGEDSSSDEDDEKKNRNQRNTESTGVTWGMLEDAVESSSDEEEEEEIEGDEKADHPDAILVHVKKDPFYMKDPVKALTTLYEREKMELDFECSERRSGHWHVSLCLPIDGTGGKPVYAEVNATGKKKDAIRQCALEACRTLERHGLFHHKGHHKERAKKWEEDDFYDSDEDEYNDRTGELEQKRNLRMKRLKKSSMIPKTVETYESLVDKITQLDNEVKDIEAKLQKDKEATKMNADSVDPLDAFMQQVKSGKALDTTTRAKLKRRLFEAKKEYMRVSKLADLARPSSMPPLASSFVKTYSFIGKMKGKKKTTLNVRPIHEPEVLEEGSKDEKDIVEENEDIEENKNHHSTSVQTKTVKLLDIKPETDVKPTLQTLPVKHVSTTNNADGTSENSPCNNGLVKVEKKETDNVEKLVEFKSQSTAVDDSIQDKKTHVAICKSPKRKLLGPTLPPELKQQLIAEQEKSSERDIEEDEGAPKPKRKRQRIRKAKPSSKVEYSDDPNYSAWLPPEGQTGDGKTSLNEKLGY